MPIEPNIKKYRESAEMSGISEYSVSSVTQILILFGSGLDGNQQELVTASLTDASYLTLPSKAIRF